MRVFNLFCPVRSFQRSTRRSPLNQSLLGSVWQTVGNGKRLHVTTISSPLRSSIRCRPSNDAQAVDRALSGIESRRTASPGSSIGRHVSVCGHIGVTRIVLRAGCTNEPPAES